MTTPTSITSGTIARNIEELRQRVSGQVILPGDDEYQQARQTASFTYNRYPSIILRAASEDDVAEGVRFARARGIPLSVRCGGHSIPGYGVMDGVLVIDLTPMRGVVIDPETRMAKVQGGARSVDLALPAHEYGLALSTGDTGTVGLGGLVTGGGVGWFVRKYGIAADRLRSARVVLATGEIVTASPTENPDLFWAVRGGGGNFGI
ncbi:MAG: FAD-binding oxidoreductase, partial [Hyphomicrobiales bacterium]